MDFGKIKSKQEFIWAEFGRGDVLCEDHLLTSLH